MQKQEMVNGVLDPEQENINTMEIARIHKLAYHIKEGTIIQTRVLKLNLDNIC